MNSFISNTAKYILENYSPANKVCVVLPNRRAGLFLKKEIASSISTPIWSPAIFSVEDFVFSLTDLQPADNAELLLALFRIVRSSKGHEEDRFDEFCKWAPALLSDFNEVDMWMADPKALFTNLADIKEIESWSLGEETLTDFQKKYLHFWDQTGLWYNALRTELLSRNKAWSGLAHRLVAENIAGNTKLAQWKHIVFAGFNALSSSQEKILSILSSGNKAKVLWDADRYYLEDPMNEAGLFLRTYREKFFGAKTEMDFPHVGDFLTATKKNITLIAAARNVSQARAAAGFLQLEGKDFIADETAVVLADETLLIPALNSLPLRFSEVNITMGYPMRNTPVFTLLHILFSLQENAQRFNIRSREGELKFYHHDVIRLLRHPYVVNTALYPDTLIEVIRQIGRRNITFVSVGKLAEIGGTEFQQQHWFEPWTSAEHCIDQLRAVIGEMKAVFSSHEEWALDVEYLYQFNLALNKISSLVKDWKEFSTVSAIKNLLLQVFGTSSIPFSGEPLAGLQVMGMLETRCLDFKNVILVSANEGMLPQQSSQHSFIMYDLRKAFGLPVHQQRDAITAYNFYRLLQRAENICIVYNTDQDTFGVKEKSRYVSQLLYELPKVNRQVTIRNIIAGAELDSSPVADDISIESSPEIVQLAAAKAAKGFSPSLINLFRECRLRFYFRYIAGLQEEKEVEENVDQNTLGTIMHASLEKLYTPYLNQPLQVADIEAMKSVVTSTVKESFRKLFPDEETDAGKNHLAGKIAVRYISTYLEQETERIKSQLVRKTENTVIALEETLECSKNVNGIPVLFKGNADRIDKMGNIIRLIDYKTGQVDEKELRIESSDVFLEGDKQGKAFQLMMYAWLYLQSKDNAAVVQPGIISFRKNRKGFMHLETPSGQVVTEKGLEDFERVLMEITKQILSPETVFAQTENVQMCRNCEFNAICRRA